MGIYGDFMGLYWMEIFKVENLQVTRGTMQNPLMAYE